MVRLVFSYPATSHEQAAVTVGKSLGLSFSICKRGAVMDNLETGSGLNFRAMDAEVQLSLGFAF